MEQNEKSINWHIGIPVVLWIAIVLLGILKTSLGVAKEGFEINKLVISLINTFNSNTFSTFLSVIICMLYQYFSTENKQKREVVSGLSMKYIPLVIILTVGYGVAAVLDAAISHLVMAIIFFIINIAYVVCFFKLFLVKK